ncbi:hypothetical protein [Methylobacterium goesingense]|uniref:hypothetical protein n=1 Tax=Methylobacterium goesingense TaxID=243690 RepID=UPI00362738BA
MTYETRHRSTPIQILTRTQQPPENPARFTSTTRRFGRADRGHSLPIVFVVHVEGHGGEQDDALDDLLVSDVSTCGTD